MIEVLAVVLILSVLGLAGVLAVSRPLRGRSRVFFSKLFSRYKYDYRREWLRFIATLSETDSGQVHSTAIRAVAQIVNSPGGILWARSPDDNEYLAIGSWESDIPSQSSVRQSSSLVKFIEDRQWIIDLDQIQRNPMLYGGLTIEQLFSDNKHWWLIVPLFLRDHLFGFIVLLKPTMTFRLNFEDHDLLKTIGRQVATHINQAESDRRLSESKQFTAYNRLTAYLMHDLNNLIAQQSLVVQNAERLRDNPEFVDDAFDTIAHSVARMERLMAQLSRKSKAPIATKVDIRSALVKAAERSQRRPPIPVLDVGNDSVYMRADREGFVTVVEHLIRNAQDACNADGEITIRLRSSDLEHTISIEDSGCGMSPQFIRERLFRPFDSTKGSQSMGIGAYQAREFVHALGGRVEVHSEPGSGTTFTMSLPAS